MRVLLFCAERNVTHSIINVLLNQGIEIVGCVFEENSAQLHQICKNKGIPTYTRAKILEQINQKILPDYDLGISYLYKKIISSTIIESAKWAFVNFHPAPVHEHRGVAACCYCLLHEYVEWAVTAHYITPGIDEGDVIMERKFSLEGIHTGIQAERYIQEQSVQLFKDFIAKYKSGETIIGKKQDLTQGIYFGNKDLELQKQIKITDQASDIDRKVKSLWFPPYHGAYIMLDGKMYTLVNEEILEEVALLYKNYYEEKSK